MSTGFRAPSWRYAIGKVKFGIEYDDGADVFAWQIARVPESRYQRIDDRIWPKWRAERLSEPLPGSVHHDESNNVRFVSRTVDGTLTPQVAFNDVKGVLDFLLSTDPVLANAVGLDIPEETRG